MSGVLLALESHATTLAAVREDAALAARCELDAVLLAATAGVSQATLPFELTDFESDRENAPVLDAIAEAVAAVRSARLRVAVTAARGETLRAAATADALHVPS